MVDANRPPASDGPLSSVSPPPSSYKGELSGNDEENPVVSVPRGFFRATTGGRADWGGGLPEPETFLGKAGQGIGTGVGIGAAFTPIGAATKPLQALGMAGKIGGSALGFGAYEALHKQEEPGTLTAPDGYAEGFSEDERVRRLKADYGIGEPESRETYMSRGLEKTLPFLSDKMRKHIGAGLHGVSVGAMMGGAGVGLGALGKSAPALGKAIESPAGGLGVDVGMLTGLTIAERLMAGEDIDMSEIMQEVVPLAIGMKAGSKLGHKLAPPTEAEIAQGRAKSAQESFIVPVETPAKSAPPEVNKETGKRVFRKRGSFAGRMEEIIADREAGRITPEDAQLYMEQARDQQVYDLMEGVAEGSVTPKEMREALESRQTSEPIEMPVPADQGYAAVSPQTRVGAKTHRKPGSRAAEVERINSDFENGVIGREIAEMDARVGDPSRSPSLREFAEGQALDAAAELQFLKDLDSNVTEQARLYNKRTGGRDITTDMLGGQQVYDYLAGRARGAKAKGQKILKERAENKERRIQAMTEALLRDPSFLKTGRPNPNMPHFVTGRKIQSDERVPATVWLADFLNGKTTIQEFFQRAIDDPSLLKTTQDAVDQAKGLKDRESDGTYEQGVPAADKTMDRARQARRRTGGDFLTYNPLWRNFDRAGRLFEMAAEKLDAHFRAEQMKMADEAGLDLSNKADAKALSRILNTTDPVEQQKWLGTAENPQAVSRALPTARRLFNELHEFRNVSRTMTGGEPLDFREGYFPHEAEQLGIAQKGWREQRFKPVAPPDMEKTSPTVRSSREMARKGKLKDSEIEWDYNKATGRYITDSVRMFSNGGALKAGDNVVEVMRNAGLKDDAAALNQVNQAAYNGRTMDFTTSGLQGSTGGQVALAASQTTKGAFNKAKYTFALSMGLMTQGVSLGLVPSQGRVGPRIAFEGFFKAFTPEIGQKWRDSYVGNKKNQGRGGITTEGNQQVDNLGGDIISSRSQKAKTRAEEIGGIFNNAIENGTGRYAYAMAEMMAKRQGITNPADVAAFADWVVGTTQSYYDVKNRAPLASDPIINLLSLAQGYAVEGANTFRSGRRGEFGAGRKVESKAQIYERFAETFLATMFLNMMRTYTLNYKGDKDGLGVLIDPEFLASNLANTGAAFIPYLPGLLPKDLPNNASQELKDLYSMVPKGFTEGQAYPAKLLWDTAVGVSTMVGSENADPDFISGILKIANSTVPGGANMYRVHEAQRKLEAGVIGEGELLHAFIFGWAATESGKEYLRDRQGGGGVSITPQENRQRYGRQGYQRPTNQRPQRPARRQR